jgi:AcrR family transcriptional regulator
VTTRNASLTAQASPTKYHHGDLRTAALHAAAAAIAADGRDTLTIRALATSLGVTHAALYRHFESVDALIDEVAAHWLNQLVVPENDTAKLLVDRYVCLAIQSPHLYRCSMDSAAQRLPLTSQALMNVRDLAAAVFAAAWPADSSRATMLRVMKTWGTMHGLLDLYRLGMIDLPGHKIADYIARTSLAPISA